jgi:diguanylate cyclase (GGDEF)-like protein/PAS domain S-box-containing protein
MDSGTTRQRQDERGQGSATALKIVIAYAVFAGLWNLFSDYFVVLLFKDSNQIHYINTIKGWLFVGVTSLLLYGLISRLLNKNWAVTQREQQTLLSKVQAQKLLSDISDNSSDVIFAKDLQGRYLLFNREASRVTGKRADQVLGQDDLALFPEGVARAIRANDRSVLEHNQIETFDEVLPTLKGELAFHCLKGPLSDPDGQVYGVFGISRDISARKQAEEALKKSEERLLIAQESAQVGIWEWDIATGQSYWSPECERLYGFSPGTLHDNNEWRRRIHPDDLRLIDAEWDTNIRDGKPFEVEYRFIRDSGETCWLVSKGRAQYDAAGKPIRLSGINMDITGRRKVAEALKISEDRYRTVFQTSLDGVAINQLSDGRYIDVNPAFLEILGYERDEIIGHTSLELNIWADPLGRSHMVDALQRGSGFHNVETRFNGKNGELVWGLMSASVMTLEGIPYVLSVTRDITERKRDEEQLRLAASVFTYAREGIVITETDGTIVDVNDTFTHITGYSRDEVLGRNTRFLNSGRQPRSFYEAMWHDLINTGYWSGEIWNKRKNGEVFAEMLTISAVRDNTGTIQRYVALFSDITPIKAHEKELERIAHYDALTGLPNRVLFADRLHQAMVQTARRGLLLAVAYLDLDGFKIVNDRHGHDAGDQLLTILAGRMKLALREGDTLARLGGDEFVVVLLDLENIAASVPMLTRLLAAAAEIVPLGELTLQVSASVGVTFFPQPDEVDADQLLRQADQAMYQAKLAGKNRFHMFDPVQDRSVRGLHESIEHIRRALAANEFVLHYQPKVNMRTGVIIGAEALIRWQHPERGLLPPAMFLPVIEDHALAIALGEWVIESALTQLDHWHQCGLYIPVSINVGALQLQQTDFVDRLRALLAGHPGITPSCIELEVLETSALQDMVKVSSVIESCREIGVMFALDDFGTGYSSLTYLKRLPATVLKIDQSFVRNMLDDPEDLAILEGVIGLASAFRRQAVAEGVETVEHGLMLLRLGCELAQGYGIARPMVGQDLPGWASRWQPDPQWAGVTALAPNDLLLLYAGVEHRAWVMAIEDTLAGKRNQPPQLDYRQCRFGAWLHADEQAEFRALPEFQIINVLHRQVHTLASQLLSLHQKGNTGEALQGLTELRHLRDLMLEQLKLLSLPDR